MKIVMFTPVNKRSSIGGCACLITHALIKGGHSVVIVQTEIPNIMIGETHDFGVKITPWNDATLVSKEIQDSDILLYQIGDNYEFHAGCLEWMGNWPGLVFLHDFFLGNLFWGWADGRREEALLVLQTWYGDEVAKTYFTYDSSVIFIEKTRESAPMTEWICSLAYGVITHSNWGTKRVVDSCPGPVQVVPLCNNKVLFSEYSANPKKAEVVPEFKVLTIGHANPNKRIQSVIEAIGSSTVLRDKTVYQLAGSIDSKYARQLFALAESLGVKLDIAGPVSDIDLIQLIQDASVVSCLRWPALEAASGSLIEALLNGKATIVTDTGFYSELPDNCVFKISPHHELDDIKRALEILLTEPKTRGNLGSDAQNWAVLEFSPDKYACKVEELAFAVIKARPLIDMTSLYGDFITRWGISGPSENLEDTLAPLRIFNGK